MIVYSLANFAYLLTAGSWGAEDDGPGLTDAHPAPIREAQKGNPGMGLLPVLDMSAPDLIQSYWLILLLHAGEHETAANPPRSRKHSLKVL